MLRETARRWVAAHSRRPREAGTAPGPRLFALENRKPHSAPNFLWLSQKPAKRAPGVF
jgi:hypothetical protein